MDFSYVEQSARIALYDDMLSTPRIIEIPPSETMDFIGKLSSEVYNQSRAMGGAIPFSAIRQVTENFIHAEFREIVVSIFDSGNTIRFSDQGPGISDKERAQLPGFSSATEDMKRYIDGVGSGLPIVREYLDVKHGTLTLDDNMNGGSVVTLSLNSAIDKASPSSRFSSQHNQTQQRDPVYSHSAELLHHGLSARAEQILSLFDEGTMLGVQEISTLTDIPLSSTHTELKRLEEAGLIEHLGTKRVLSEIGREVLKAR